MVLDNILHSLGSRQRQGHSLCCRRYREPQYYWPTTSTRRFASMAQFCPG